MALADSLSRMYEALYDTAWGVPSRDRQQLIKELDLRLDPDISVGPDMPRTRLPSPQQQLDPAPGPGRGGGQRHVAAASSGKVGGEIIISVSASDIDFDESTPSPVKRSNLKRVRKQPTSISHSINTPKQQTKRVRYTIPASGSIAANEPNEDDDRCDQTMLNTTDLNHSSYNLVDIFGTIVLSESPWEIQNR